MGPLRCLARSGPRRDVPAWRDSTRPLPGEGGVQAGCGVCSSSRVPSQRRCHQPEAARSQPRFVVRCTASFQPACKTCEERGHRKQVPVLFTWHQPLHDSLRQPECRTPDHTRRPAPAAAPHFT
ncbi:unnamed protein product [Eretmochelys imbricata]